MCVWKSSLASRKDRKSENKDPSIPCSYIQFTQSNLNLATDLKADVKFVLVKHNIKKSRSPASQTRFEAKAIDYCLRTSCISTRLLPIVSRPITVDDTVYEYFLCYS